MSQPSSAPAAEPATNGTSKSAAPLGLNQLGKAGVNKFVRMGSGSAARLESSGPEAKLTESLSIVRQELLRLLTTHPHVHFLRLMVDALETQIHVIRMMMSQQQTMIDRHNELCAVVVQIHKHQGPMLKWLDTVAEATVVTHATVTFPPRDPLLSNMEPLRPPPDPMQQEEEASEHTPEEEVAPTQPNTP
jgi:hypothetical protein